MSEISDRVDEIVRRYHSRADEIGAAAALRELASALELAERDVQVVEDDVPPSIETYHGPIEIGQHFFWNVDNPRSREQIIVTRIDDRPHDERIIWTAYADGRLLGNAHMAIWNEESRFREAVTPADAHWHIIPGTRYVDPKEPT